MKVELIEHTPNMEKLCALSAWGCHRKDIPSMDEITEEKTKEVLRMAIDSGHTSVVEHGSFTFGVERISRACSHQLVRHRLASYSQQSQRVVDMDNPSFITPKNIEESSKSLWFENILEEIRKLYGEMQRVGIPNEDARFILPNATPTNIVITMNCRELYHFFKLRCCEKAQWEIRDMAQQMLKKCKEIAPIIFENAGAPCETGEGCPEVDTCDRWSDDDYEVREKSVKNLYKR